MTAQLGEIYYLPGRGGQLDTGLGLALLNRGLRVTGRQTLGDFQRLKFSDQIQVIADDIQSLFCSKDALVIANSFGTYLLLHSLTLIPPFPGKALLLSPIIGGSSAPGNGPRFMPPFADRILSLADAGSFPSPKQCEIHVGELDWQCQPDRLRRFGELAGIPVTVVPGGGHMLDKDYVSGLLDRWLQAPVT